MQTTIPLAEVETATASYYKARVVITDDGMQVQNQRGHVLETVTGSATPTGEGAWALGEATARPLQGCKCGGTRVTPK